MAMMSPVRCTYCGKTYDLAAVEVTQRYADCSVFKTPCCGRQADDREWKSMPDFRRVPDGFQRHMRADGTIR